jgi:hypothetical protein
MSSSSKTIDVDVSKRKRGPSLKRQNATICRCHSCLEKYPSGYYCSKETRRRHLLAEIEFQKRQQRESDASESDSKSSNCCSHELQVIDSMEVGMDPPDFDLNGQCQNKKIQ